MAKRGALRTVADEAQQQERQQEGPAAKPADHIRLRGEVFRAPAPLKRLDSGKIVTTVDLKAEQVFLNGKEVDAAEHRFHRVDFWGAKAVQAQELQPGTMVTIEGTHDVRAYKGHDQRDYVSSEIKNTDAHPLQMRVDSAPKLTEIRGSVAFQPELKMSANDKFYVQVVVDPENGPRHSATFYGESAQKTALEINKGDVLSLRGQQVEREWEGRNGPQRGFEIKNPSYEVLSKSQSLEQGLSR